MMILTVTPGHKLVGLGVVGLGAWASMGLAAQPLLQNWGLGALTVAIVLGMVLGHVPRVQAALAGPWAAGVDFAKGPVLRCAIVLYGLQLSVQDIAALGWQVLALDVFIVASTFTLAVLLGQRWLGLDRRTAALIGAGSAICGAAAVLASAPVVRARAHDVGVAVATVVVFGTLGMALYPWLGQWLWPDGLETALGYGIYTGATVHEVAQVVVAGSAVSAAAAHTAVITKMLRVLLLAPFLLLLSWWLGRVPQGAAARQPLAVPWFALGFLAMVGLHSSGLLPERAVQLGLQLDQVLLTMAMLALGMGLQWQALRRAGSKPLWLAGVLWLWLLGAGAVLTRWGW